MSKPDVPSLEACERLAKVLPASVTYWIYWGDKLSCRERLCTCALCRTKRDYTSAPTLGEMLAEIRRRGWRVTLTISHNSTGTAVTWVGVWRPGDTLPAGSVTSESPANAMANALAEALEQEGAGK